MLYLQILVSLFIVIILFKLFKQRQASKISTKSFLLWIILWLIIAVVFWQPDTTSYIANLFGVQRGADLAIYVAIIVILYLLFRVFVRLNKIDSDITKLVREDAIKHAKEK